MTTGKTIALTRRTFVGKVIPRAYSNSCTSHWWLPSNHFIFCRPPLLLPSVFPSIWVFSNESVLHIRWPKYWSFSFNISPSNEYSGLISFRIEWLDLLTVQGTLKSLLQHHSSKASILKEISPEYSLERLMLKLKLTDAKSWLIEKDPDAGKDWRQEEKGETEDEMAGWHHQLEGHESEWTPGVGDGQGGHAWCSP